MGCGNSTAGGAGGRGATGTTKDAPDYFTLCSRSITLGSVSRRASQTSVTPYPFYPDEQKNLYQMMTKGGTMAVCMLVCHRMRLPWFPVRRKLHQKIRRK